MVRLRCTVGRVELKNPLIAAAAEHMIDAAGVEAAIRAGAGAAVVKSTNESEAAKDQLQRAEYVALGADWRPVPWSGDAPDDVTIASRSGLTPQFFETWLDQAVALERKARARDCVLVASLILADLDQAVGMARQVEQAGLPVLEFNIGTPYASQAAKGAVSTELSPERVGAIVARIRQTVSIPLWIKLTGQSERVPDLADAAFSNGADSVVMAGRLLGFIPDVETLEPMLGTSLAVGGFWNLPLTCQWLALSRARLGPDRPLIGINGARNGLDIARMLLAGASAAGIASAVMLRGFGVIGDSLAELDRWLEGKGLTAGDAVGLAADRRKSFAQMPLRTDHWRQFIPAAPEPGRETR
ncbi:dihydroorotate dehydrogenase [Mesorhizobium sp. CU2]|uniref:dihydroorotate dehydrogenase n=1 Tax=unclassified Mesorhizobium TaxID=325217 RepID=UPI00112694C7|nr:MULTISPECIES: dihydroorotate dehydrogenase [unclassified Mesorhizobium]TPN85609.1 dihydroorotate dehydrogenase [Mesorhizobium sp. CU3]TPO10287.1 dihydroorotate dehydrogenase [Mesorhizobium sp. CU2]